MLHHEEKSVERKLWYIYLPFLYDRLEGRDGGGSLKADETEQESKLHLAPTGVFVLQMSHIN